MARTSTTPTKTDIKTETPAKVAPKDKVASKAKAPVKDAPVKTEAKAKAPAKGKAEVKTEVVESKDGEVTATVSGDASVEEECAAIRNLCNQMIAMAHATKKAVVLREKRHLREMKIAQKLSMKKKVKKEGGSSPSGFTMPVRISDDRARYLNEPLGCMISRTDVTKKLNGIFREQGMQDKVNGRIIHPTPEFAKLLNISATDDELTYFNLQKYMAPHFEKKSRPFPPSVATVVA